MPYEAEISVPTGFTVYMSANVTEIYPTPEVPGYMTFKFVEGKPFP